MSQIDFYILSESSPRNINQMVCRLCEKAIAQDMNVFLYTRSPHQAQELDELLWSFKADSFIAHQDLHNPISSDTSYNYPVLISSAELTEPTAIEQYTQLLINLTTETPSFYKQFARIAELVGKDESEKTMARDRFRFYRSEGHNLNKFDL